MPLTIPATDLLRWNADTATHWRDFLNANPTILALPYDVRASQTVAGLLQHIVAVELRYAQRLAAQPESDYATIPFDTADALFGTHRQALDIFQTLLAEDTYDWQAEIEFRTITLGMLKAPRRTILIHALMHSVRHYAQLATLVREHGFKPTWPMDYLFMDALPV